jgi:hypothetical protein
MAASFRTPWIIFLSSAADSAVLTATHGLIQNATTGPSLLDFRYHRSITTIGLLYIFSSNQAQAEFKSTSEMRLL